MNSHEYDLLITGCPDAGQRRAFYFGGLPQDQISQLAAHLERCLHCAATLQSLEGQTDELVEAVRRLRKVAVEPQPPESN